MPKEYLQLKQDDCRGCYHCIRNCPVKAISFANSHARIVDTECILCGRCFVACPQQATEIHRDADTARKLIAGSGPVYASLAPSFVAYFPGADRAAAETALLRLGFAGAEETALGATLVKRRYDELVREGRQSVLISSCCHSITLLLQKHFPDAVQFLAPVLSPMQAHCFDLKKRHPGAKTVFIGPCLSKKAEADQFPGSVDCVLTFEELTAWLREEDVPLPASEPRRESASLGRARLFPTTGGILRSMEKANGKYHYLAVDGVGNCMRAVRDILCGAMENCFIEMSACAGSCIGGPGMGRRGTAEKPVTGFVAVEDSAGPEDFSLDQPGPDELKKLFPSAPQCRIKISEAAIRDVLKKIGKTRPEHELNCGSCGYPTCREKAAAVVRGKADVSMCLPFLKAKAESFSDAILTNTPNSLIVLNESLVVQQLNEAACRILQIRDPRDLLGSKVTRVLDPDIFVEVISGGQNVFERKTYLPEYRKYARMTVIHDKAFHVLILIMRDVTDEETARSLSEERNRKTAEVAGQVIEKQMRVVQEIASLLGETAAETKVALTKLKESLDVD
jgi:iron only hydrogenase large subunit-like protein/uncharacterized Fe-S cluster-containing protein